MANYTEGCHDESKEIFTTRDEVAYVLDERRRAALAEVNNAKSSCVFLVAASICASAKSSSQPIICQGLLCRWCQFL